MQRLQIFFGSESSVINLVDPKGRLSSEIHFLVPLGITYSDSILCGNTLDQIYWLVNHSKKLRDKYFFQ